MVLRLIDTNTDSLIDTVTEGGWSQLQELAKYLGGWQPRGTVCPPGWDDVDCHNYKGIIVAEDAHALADALERALPYVRDVPLCDPEDGTILFTFDYQDKEWLRELIDGLRHSGDVLTT